MIKPISRFIGATGATVLVLVFWTVAGCRQSEEEPTGAMDTMATMTSMAAASDTAQYSVSFTRLWTGQTHPFEYPETTAKSGPHFSGLIGATHGDSYALFAEGTPPTPGLEKLSEEGKHTPLDQEIQAAIGAGTAGSFFETGPIRDASKTETVTFTISSKTPMVSAVAMIAPSPDWFAGVKDVNLLEGGQWVNEKTVEMSAYDSGGDDGTTYRARDKDTNPKKPTAAADSRHFVINGGKPPVGRLTFTKI